MFIEFVSSQGIIKKKLRRRSQRGCNNKAMNVSYSSMFRCIICILYAPLSTAHRIIHTDYLFYKRARLLILCTNNNKNLLKINPIFCHKINGVHTKPCTVFVVVTL